MPRKITHTDKSDKQRKKRTAPTNTSLLPPCRVCLEPAAGFHYGANTCEACKGFFRRTLLRKGDYDCIVGDEKCDVEKSGKSRMCPRCRHLKCLAVGMSTGAIKTGRYTLVKRTQDILDYKQAKKLNNKKDTLPAVSVVCPSTPTAAVTSTSAPTVTSSGSASHYVPSADFSRVSPSGSGSHGGLTASAPYLPASSHRCVDVQHYTDLSPVPSVTSPQNTPGKGDSVQSGVSTDATSPANPQELLSPVSMSSFMQGMFDHVVEGETGRSDVSSLVSKDCSTSTPPSIASPVCSSSSPAEGVPSGWLSEEECEKLTRHLVQSHTECGLINFQLSHEEMLEKQTLYHENCKARIEAFGPLGKVSEAEYQEVYQTTGIDVDDRQTFVTLLSKALDDHIHKYIGFVKMIPGFSQLLLKDQVRLIRDNRCEIFALAQAKGYNHKLKVLTMPSGRTFCDHDMEKFGGKELMQARIKCLHAIQKLGLSDEENILMKCVILFTPGNDDVDDPQQVSALQWKMAQCLRWLLKQNTHPDPDMCFARIISTFVSLRELASAFYEWLKSKPFEHYAQFKQNELLAEWFSNS